MMTSSFQRFLVILSTIPRDISGVYYLIRVAIDLAYYNWFNFTILDSIETLSRTDPDKPCFIYEKDVWTFRQIQNQVELIQKYFASHFGDRLKSGDCVALMMNNHPLYPCIWLGFARMGVSTALINTNLRKEQLQHVLNACQPKLLVAGDNFKEEISQIRLECEVIYIDTSDCKNGVDFNSVKNLPPVDRYNGINKFDALLHIFTSGTTGLPKMAKITHYRFLLGGCGCYHVQNMKSSEVIYNPLPLYHSMGGWLCLSYALLYGNTVVIKKKFSVSSFWKDCVTYNCTRYIYIGEMNRYLLNSQQSKYEKLHNIQCAAGNGLRKEIWAKFVERFGAIKCIEFYASTEGNCYFFNIEGIIGSCGFNSVIFPCFLPSILVKIDENDQQPLRNSLGYCIKCPYDVTGMLISPISKSVWRRFDGYNNENDSNQKIITNVLKPNDMYFVTDNYNKTGLYII
ncbi:hypothetical protein GJ496_002264, partial [Pomphorhynchus laevis]